MERSDHAGCLWWRPANKRFTTNPRHGSRDIPKGTLREILRDLDITPRELDRA